MMKRKRNQPLAVTTSGWELRKGDTVKRKGVPLLLVGREGNLVLVRPFVPPSALPASTFTSSIPVRKVHPSELGIRSNVTLPHYVR